MQTLTATEGLITKVIGPVIDVEFPSGDLPSIYTALNIFQDDGTKVVAESGGVGHSKDLSLARSRFDGTPGTLFESLPYVVLLSAGGGGHCDRLYFGLRKYPQGGSYAFRAAQGEGLPQGRSLRFGA